MVFLDYKSSCLKKLHKQDVNAKQKCTSFTLASESTTSQEALGTQAGHQTDLPRGLSVQEINAAFRSNTAAEARAGRKRSQKILVFVGSAIPLSCRRVKPNFYQGATD